MKVGVTGHRNFEDVSAAPWVAECIHNRLSDCRELYGLTSLAKGADQIFARVVLQLGGSLEAVLPFPEYANTFQDSAESAGFDELIGRCSKVTQLDFAGSKEQSYFAAGKYVVDHSEVLIAVWDGKPAAGLGGTGDVVAYARKNGKQVHQIDPVSRTVGELA
jgi:hypothetical protein